MPYVTLGRDILRADDPLWAVDNDKRVITRAALAGLHGGRLLELLEVRVSNGYVDAVQRVVPAEIRWRGSTRETSTS